MFFFKFFFLFLFLLKFEGNKKNLTNVNGQKLKKAQNELINTYQKEQIEYIQGQINKIRNSIEERQLCIVWQTVNEMNKGGAPPELN